MGEGKLQRKKERQSGRAETKTDGKEDCNYQPGAEQERRITTEIQSKGQRRKKQRQTEEILHVHAIQCDKEGRE